MRSALATSFVDFGSSCSNPRSQRVTKITIHHMAGIGYARNVAQLHKNGGRCSANYYIGNDGGICAGVDEGRRAWTSSSSWNDQRAITIEVSNSTGAPEWRISAAAYASLIALCADICRRYGIVPAYDGTKDGSLTEHKMFAATACPGHYIHNLLATGQIQRDITAVTGGAPNGQQKTQNAAQTQQTAESAAENAAPYLVRINTPTLNIRRGPGTNYKVTGAVPKGEVYTIVETQNGWGRLKSGAGWISLAYTLRV